jgi:hypothetical protein
VLSNHSSGRGPLRAAGAGAGAGVDFRAAEHTDFGRSNERCQHLCFVCLFILLFPGDIPNLWGVTA